VSILIDSNRLEALGVFVQNNTGSSYMHWEGLQNGGYQCHVRGIVLI